MGGTIFYIVLIILLFATIRYFRPPEQTVEEKSVTEFVQELKNNNVVSITMEEGTNTIAHVKLKDDTRFITLLPDSASQDLFNSYISDKVSKGEIKYNLQPKKVTPFYFDLIPSFLMIGALIFIWYRICLLYTSPSPRDCS